MNGPTVWVEPELVAEVKFQDWTKDGYYWVLEASLVMEGRAIPFYCLAVQSPSEQAVKHLGVFKWLQIHG